MQDRLPISRPVVRIAIGMFVVAYGTNVSTPFLVLYKDRLELSASQTMAIFVVYVVGILASLVLGGVLSDRFGRRPIVLPMMALSGIASVGMIFGRDEFIALRSRRPWCRSVASVEGRQSRHSSTGCFRRRWCSRSCCMWSRSSVPSSLSGRSVKHIEQNQAIASGHRSVSRLLRAVRSCW